MKSENVRENIHKKRLTKLFFDIDVDNIPELIWQGLHWSIFLELF
jgi:hypothetical protein